MSIIIVNISRKFVGVHFQTHVHIALTLWPEWNDASLQYLQALSQLWFQFQVKDQNQDSKVKD